MTDIRIDAVVKSFGEFPALHDVSLEIPDGELVALLGPSGSGKTTLLRVIAGLEVPDRGRVALGGTDVSALPIQKRGIGFVFQDYALFEHMTVADNIAFGLTVRRTPAAAIRARVRELLARVQLADLAARYPDQLSGGQRQRVALARALAPEPRVLLLDEPFGALDARVRAELRSWLRRLHDELGVTTVFVTHDQDEALEVADRVVVLDRGRIEQVGTPAEIYDRPASAFVMDFLGGVNVIDGTYVRGHDLRLARDGDGIAVTVSHVRMLGVSARVVVRSDAHGELVAELPRHELAELAARRGDRLIATVRTAHTFSTPTPSQEAVS